VAAFAVGATGTAMTGSPNPTAWGQAIEEAASSAAPVRPEETPSQSAPAPASTLPAAPRSAAVVGSAARHEQRSDPRPAGSHEQEPSHTANSSHRVKPTPTPKVENKEQDQQGSEARRGHSGAPGRSSDARTEPPD
jgi:hypothetical protein